MQELDMPKENAYKLAIQKEDTKLIKIRGSHLVEVGVNYDPEFRENVEEVNIEELIANIKVTSHKQR